MRFLFVLCLLLHPLPVLAGKAESELQPKWFRTLLEKGKGERPIFRNETYRLASYAKAEPVLFVYPVDGGPYWTYLAVNVIAYRSGEPYGFPLEIERFDPKSKERHVERVNNLRVSWGGLVYDTDTRLLHYAEIQGGPDSTLEYCYALKGPWATDDLMRLQLVKVSHRESARKDNELGPIDAVLYENTAAAIDEERPAGIKD